MTCGIYLIEQLSSGLRYVGSAVNIENRWSSHRATLGMGKHPNTYLQRVWKKYGLEDFRFSIIEECPRDALTNREQYWMDLWEVCNPKKGFNLQPVARSCLGVKHKPETISKMRAKAKVRNAEPSYNAMIRERASKQWSEGRLGPGNFPPEMRKAVGAKAAATRKDRGRVTSLETRARMSEAAKRRIARDGLPALCRKPQ